MKTSGRQRSSDAQQRDTVGSGMARGDDVVAAGDGLRQIGDGVHAQAGKCREVDLVIGSPSYPLPRERSLPLSGYADMQCIGVPDATTG